MNRLLVFASLLAILGVISSAGNPTVVKSILNNFMDGSVKDLFKVWHLVYEKSYTLDSEEARQRFSNFKYNLRKIKEHNAKGGSYKKGLNHLSDMTSAEVRAYYGIKSRYESKEQWEKIMADIGVVSPAKNFLDDEDDDLTSRRLQAREINWSGFFREPRNQDNCGSCWAFAVAGTVEGQLGVSRNRVLDDYLSPQHLVDCDKKNSACNGGAVTYAFNFVKKTGLVNEKNYPYKKKQCSCKAPSSGTTKITDFESCSNYSSRTINHCNQSKVLELLSKGPCTVGIDAGTEDFQSYESGVYTANCEQDNHAVILAGYGIDNDQEYFLVRNSWGADWGEKGYIRVARNDENKVSCFVANELIRAII